MRISIVLALIAFLSIGCNPDVNLIEDALPGNWAINEAVDNHGNLVMPSANLISFKKNKTGASSIFEGEDFTWQVIVSDSAIPVLRIETELGWSDFTIDFIDNADQHLLDLHLTAQKLEVICSKMLFDYFGSNREIQKLTNLKK
jgi:hypothetical protein